VGFFQPACAVGAAGIGAGVFGAALAYLAMGTDGDLPGLPGDAGDRVLLRLPRSQPTSR
jgi:hypothetical protein